MQDTDRKKERKTELLAPGGSLEGLKAAINAGADAVYMGGQKFGARAYAKNPDSTELIEAMDYCHLRGRRLYLTVNTLLKETELERDLYQYLLPLVRHGLDAVLVQDFGVLRFIREHFPLLPVHASTQMTIMGVSGAKMLKRLGAERIVPSRELTLEEIREIHRRVDIEIECFVHGALCYSYSGQCLMSSMIGGRSGNRGRCAQPCRLPYTFFEGRSFPGAENSRTGYLLSLKDICTLRQLPDLIEAGVCSFKIEGRMKRAEYASGVTEIYRKYLDYYLKTGRRDYRVDPEDERQLMDLYNRGGFSQGYYKTYNGKNMMSMERPNHQGTPGAKTVSAQGKVLRLKAEEQLWPGDVLEIPVKKGGIQEAAEVTVREGAAPGKIFEVSVPGSCGSLKGRTLSRVKCTHLLSRLEEDYGKKEKKEKIKGRFILGRGKAAILTVKWENGTTVRTARAEGDLPMEAQSRPIDQETVSRQLSKTGNTPFVFETLEIEMDEGIFYPMQGLNELRRSALSELERAILDPYKRDCGSDRAECMEETGADPWKKERSGKSRMSASVETMEQLDAVFDSGLADTVYLDCCMFQEDPDLSFEQTVKRMHKKGIRCFLMLPGVWRTQTVHGFEEAFPLRLLDQADGFLLRSNEQLEYLRGLSGQKEMIADAGLYSYNKEARRFLSEQGISMDTAPQECSRRELGERGCQGSEIVIYGRLPLMLTAQCLVKNTFGCRKTPGNWSLRDRKGAGFPVKNRCSICTNVIYNSVPLDLLSCREEVMGLHPASCRLSFTIENRKEAEAVLARAAEWQAGRKVTGETSGSTRGHFKRGVE